MPHAPSFDHARDAHRSSNFHSLLWIALAAFLSAAACTTAQSHPGGGSGGNASGGETGQGSGGTTGTGSGGSSNGAGGATGSGGHVADAGSDTHAGTGGATGGCAGLPLCDDFETASGTLNTALWTPIPTPLTGGASATIDSIGAHGSGHSLKITSPNRAYLRNSSVIGTLGPIVHVRFYARFSTALPQNHGAIIVTHPTPVDQYTQNNELRFGSQDAVFHWNTDSDVNIPTVGPGDSSSVGVTPNTWYCFELIINTNGHLNVSINGNDVAGLTEDGVATPNIDDAWVGSTASLMRYMAFGDFNFGWQGFGGDSMTIWFDDVALSSAPIGCSN
jgi:hypothetical protein